MHYVHTHEMDCIDAMTADDRALSMKPPSMIQRHQAKAASASVAALMLGVIAMAAWMLLDARQAAFRQAEQAAGNLVLSLERDISRNIELYDLSLRSAADSFALPGLAEFNPAIRQAVLFDSSTAAPYFGSIALVDAAGQIVYASNSARPMEGNLGTRDWFTYLREHPNGGLHLSLTPLSLLSGKPSLVLSRAITRGDGSFAGAVVGVIHLAYFNQLLTGYSLDKESMLNIVTTAGQVVARQPYNEQDIGRDVSQGDEFQRQHPASSGSFEVSSSLDGIERLVVYRRLGSLPLITQVGVSTRTIYAAWRFKAWVAGGVLAAFITITVLLTRALRRELRSRARLAAELSKSETGFRLLAEHASDMVSRVGPDGAHRYVSPACSRIFGVPSAALLGHRLIERVQPKDQAAVTASTRRLLAGFVEQDSITFQAHRPDGRGVWIEATARPLRDPATGAPDGYIAIFRDITERHQIETEREARGRELETVNADLERMTRHLSRARDQAERANRAKSRFLAGMSHELRTPLNGILGYAQLLYMEGSLDSKQRMRVDRMLEAGQHLLHMINRVLDLSEIEASNFVLNTASVDLPQLAESCLDIVRPAADAKGLRLLTAPGASLQVLADAPRVRQVVLNLLGNAVKFTSRGTIELRVLAAADAMLRIEVADTGPGISRDQSSLLFRDFERLNAGVDHVEGAGLGLAISARLAALMGGRLGHGDNPGGGSVFWLELPVAAVPSVPAEAALPKPRAHAGPRRVLVVDDVSMNRDIASSFLVTAGHDVTCAESGEEAIERARAEDYDVVLMDVRMPEMDGLEATRRIRMLDGPRGQVPVVALTAQAFAEQVEECRRAGMNSHLAKPFAQSALLDAVARAATEAEMAADPPARRAEPEMPDQPVCDVATFDGIAAFIKPDKFVGHMSKIIERSEALLHGLREQAHARSAATHGLAEAAHSLAGSAGMFGYQRLAFNALRYEQAIETASRDMPAVVESLIAAVEVSLKRMKAQYDGLVEASSQTLSEDVR